MQSVKVNFFAVLLIKQLKKMLLALTIKNLTLFN